MAEEKNPQASLQIVSYLHCGLCIESKPRSQSPEQWMRFGVGLTEHGIQVWCVRHNVNVVHFAVNSREMKVNASRDPNRDVMMTLPLPKHQHDVMCSCCKSDSTQS